MFNALRVKPFKLTPEEAARAKEEQEVALDELVESGRMPRKVAEDVKGRQRTDCRQRCMYNQRQCRICGVRKQDFR